MLLPSSYSLQRRGASAVSALQDMSGNAPRLLGVTRLGRPARNSSGSTTTPAASNAASAAPPSAQQASAVFSDRRRRTVIQLAFSGSSPVSEDSSNADEALPFDVWCQGVEEASVSDYVLRRRYAEETLQYVATAHSLAQSIAALPVSNDDDDKADVVVTPDHLLLAFLCNKLPCSSPSRVEPQQQLTVTDKVLSTVQRANCVAQQKLQAVLQQADHCSVEEAAQELVRMAQQARGTAAAAAAQIGRAHV